MFPFDTKYLFSVQVSHCKLLTRNPPLLVKELLKHVRKNMHLRKKEIKYTKTTTELWL